MNIFHKAKPVFMFFAALLTASVLGAISLFIWECGTSELLNANFFRGLLNYLGPVYFIISGIILLVFGFFWFLAGRRPRNYYGRRLLLSFALALAFTPTIWGFDVGSFTVPAFADLLLSSNGGSVVLFYSLFSIAFVWSVLLVLLLLPDMMRRAPEIVNLRAEPARELRVKTSHL